jgi:signal transduction histidine kinase
MADFYSIKDDAAKLITQLGTEIDLFFVLGSLLLLLDAYLYAASNRHYSLLTFDWSSQHGFNVGAIVGFFLAFSFVMTVLTPLLLIMVRFMMLLPCWFTFMFLLLAILLALDVSIPFLGAIFIVLATAPTWQEITWFLRDKEKEREKWRAPHGYVSASELREYAYKNEKVYLLDRLDKHYAAKAAAENNQLARLAASFVVTIVINAVVGYTGHATMVWRLFDWSSGLSENLQKWVQIAGVIFGFLVFGVLTELFRSDLDPDWVYYPPLAEENERKRQEEREQQARFEREAEARRQSREAEERYRQSLNLD